MKRKQATVTLYIGQHNDKQVQTVKSVIRYLNARTDNASFPEGMTVDDVYITGNILVDYDMEKDSPAVRKNAQIRPHDTQSSIGFVNIFTLTLVFSFERENYADMDELLAMSNFVYSFVEKSNLFNGEAKIESQEAHDLQTDFFRNNKSANGYLLSHLLKIYSCVDDYGTAGPTFDALKEEFVNTQNVSQYVREMFWAVNYEPENIWLESGDQSQQVRITVRNKHTCNLSEITKVYYIYKNYVYTTGKIDFSLYVEPRAHVVLNTNRVPWLYDNNFFISCLKKDNLIDGRGISADKLIHDYKEREADAWIDATPKR